MNDWTKEKTTDFTNKAIVIGNDLLREVKMLETKILFTTNEQDQQDMLKRLNEIEQESIVLKKLVQKIAEAYIEYLILNGEEES